MILAYTATVFLNNRSPSLEPISLILITKTEEGSPGHVTSTVASKNMNFLKTGP